MRFMSLILQYPSGPNAATVRPSDPDLSLGQITSLHSNVSEVIDLSGIFS